MQNKHFSFFSFWCPNFWGGGWGSSRLGQNPKYFQKSGLRAPLTHFHTVRSVVRQGRVAALHPDRVEFQNGTNLPRYSYKLLSLAFYILSIQIAFLSLCRPRFYIAFHIY